MLSADFHAVLDRLEEPEALLRQSIREMEEAIDAAAFELRSVQTELTGVTAKRDEADRKLDAIESELDVCFAAKDHQLARSVVRRKLEQERIRVALGQKRDGLEENARELAKRLAEHRELLEGMRQKSEVFGEPADEAASCGPATDFRVHNDEVESAFLREQQRRVSR